MLSFLRTSYFDDVLVEKPTYGGLQTIALVAEIDAQIVGLMDDVVVYSDGLATVETIAVTSELSRRGIGFQLLVEAIAKLSDDVGVVDAWTREDDQANSWYLRHGFRQTYAYLNVFADSRETATALEGVREGLAPVAGWFHAGRA